MGHADRWLTAGWCLALLATAWLAGCQDPCEPACIRPADERPFQISLVTTSPPALLFDQEPGIYQPAGFYREAWPSTTAWYTPGEVIFFDQRFIDHQHGGPGRTDWVYRRSESRRTGIGYR